MAVIVLAVRKLTSDDQKVAVARSCEKDNKVFLIPLKLSILVCFLTAMASRPSTPNLALDMQSLSVHDTPYSKGSGSHSSYRSSK